MANGVDTSRLLGVDTISGIVDRAWTDMARAAAQYGPAIFRVCALLPLFRELSASGVDVIMRFWVSEANIASYPVISMQIREAAKEALQANGMALPFPHLQLHIDGAEGLEAFVPTTPERPTQSQRGEH